MSRYNRWGAVNADVLQHYPDVTEGEVGATRLQSLLDDATAEIAGALSQRAHEYLTRPCLELIEDDAADGATSVSLGLTPVVAGSVHLWVRAPGDDRPRPRSGEVESSDFSLTASTGAITLSNALAEHDQVWASYEVDVDDSGHSRASLKRVVAMGAAAALGGQLSDTVEGGGSWEHVDRLRERYLAILDEMRQGRWIPDELRRLQWWLPVDRPGGVGSVRTFRG